MQNTKIKPINFPFPTLNECHLHVDSWMSTGFLKSTIPDFFNTGKEHNFDHFIRDDAELNIFHGNEPIEHASKYFDYNKNTINEMKNLCVAYLESLEKNGFKGYLEYEMVQEVDIESIAFNLNNDEIKYEDSKLPKMMQVSTKLDERKLYYETHYTIPVNLLRKNILFFKKLKIRGVSLDKFGKDKIRVKHVVLTGLYEDIYSAICMFTFLESLKMPLALKFEQKKFILPNALKDTPSIFILKEVVDSKNDIIKANKLEEFILNNKNYGEEI